MRSFKWLLGAVALGAFSMLHAENAGIPAVHDTPDAKPPVASVAPAQVDHPLVASGLGQGVDNATLSTLSGGTLIQQNTNLTGTVSENSADHVVTGDNVITGGSVAGATGFPTIIQNSGNNVLIQNATVLNVEFKQ